MKKEGRDVPTPDNPFHGPSRYLTGDKQGLRDAPWIYGRRLERRVSEPSSFNFWWHAQRTG